MTPQFPPHWQRYFAPPAAPRPPVDPRPMPPESPPLRGRVLAGTGFPHSRSRWSLGPLARPRRALELAWLTCQMPEWMREAAAENLRQTLHWRAQYCKPLKQPKTPLAWTRFGLQGERLCPRGTLTVRKLLKREARESVRLVEGMQPHLERNHRLAMRGARLGQLCLELEERGLDALEILRWELTSLWE